MPQSSRTFRVFISSTFSDLETERDALQTHVFPELRQICQRRGTLFQAVDLRWGVSEEAGQDQRTMAICLGEIRRSQLVSRRPNFLVLLGERYGWRPLPAQIDRDEWNHLTQYLSEDERERLARWYRLDEYLSRL